MNRKIGLVVIIIIISLMFYSLGSQIYEAMEAGKRLDRETEELARLQQQNNELKKKLAEVDNPLFIEKQARDKLNLARPGETVVLIPQEEMDRIISLQEEKEEVKDPYWLGWLRLFI